MKAAHRKHRSGRCERVHDVDKYKPLARESKRIQRYALDSRRLATTCDRQNVIFSQTGCAADCKPEHLRIVGILAGLYFPNEPSEMFRLDADGGTLSRGLPQSP